MTKKFVPYSIRIMIMMRNWQVRCAKFEYFYWFDSSIFECGIFLKQYSLPHVLCKSKTRTRSFLHFSLFCNFVLWAPSPSWSLKRNLSLLNTYELLLPPEVLWATSSPWTPMSNLSPWRLRTNLFPWSLRTNIFFLKS